MTIAYFDCFAGISGDMTLGAIIDAGLSLRKLKAELKKLPVDGYTLSTKTVLKCGVTATKATVKIQKSSTAHGHRHYSDIVKLIDKSKLSAGVKERAQKIFRVIAEAEAEVHGVDIKKVHFHEVGAVDSIVDIVGAAIGFVELGIDEVYSSPVNTGSGSVKTEHGILPIPAPATALILKNIPTYADGPAKELTTPTGAAILKAMAQKFGPQPMMTVNAIGTGAGGYDFDDRPNIVRLFIGDRLNTNFIEERLVEISTNIDDMNPQRYGDVSQNLFEAGALDVTVTPVQMKKGRPAVTLSVLVEPEKSGAIEKILFCHTTTLGLKRSWVERISLPRKIVTVKTKYGPVKVKVATLPDGGEKRMPEYDSVLKTAKKANVSFDGVWREAIKRKSE